jgi:hypothetical protein
MAGGWESGMKQAAVRPIAMKKRTDVANVRIMLAADAELPHAREVRCGRPGMNRA